MRCDQQKKANHTNTRDQGSHSDLPGRLGICGVPWNRLNFSIRSELVPRKNSEEQHHHTAIVTRSIPHLANGKGVIDCPNGIDCNSREHPTDRPLRTIAGHVSRKMLEHYSHIRMEAKRAALDAIASQPSQAVFEMGVNQNVNQPSGGDLRASAKSLN